MAFETFFLFLSVRWVLFDFVSSVSIVVDCCRLCDVESWILRFEPPESAGDICFVQLDDYDGRSSLLELIRLSAFNRLLSLTLDRVDA